jgi:hypothetical protein
MKTLRRSPSKDDALLGQHLSQARRSVAAKKPATYKVNAGSVACCPSFSMPEEQAWAPVVR